MPVNRLKDRTGLVATRSLLASHVYERVEGSPSRQYFKLYLWEKPEQLRRGAKLEADGVAVGCHCPTFVRYRFDEKGVETQAPRLLLGELHFAAGHWTDEVVAHELMHALFEADRSEVGASRLGELEDGPLEYEEEWCYRFGRWFAVVYKWLWTEDPTLAQKRAVVG